FLRPDEAIISEWRKRLSSLGPGLKIGISWKGGTDKTRWQARSVPLEAFRPILDLEGAQFVSLQYGDVKDDVARANSGLARPVVRFDKDEIDDFEQLAGLVSALDLVVTVQTAVVHLCGAIGHPCWVMVPYAAQWRYGAEGSSIPWYSAVKLFRQRASGEW